MFYILSKEEAFELIQKQQVSETLQDGIHRAKVLCDENKTEYVLLQELSKIDFKFKKTDFYNKTLDDPNNTPYEIVKENDFLDLDYKKLLSRRSLITELKEDIDKIFNNSNDFDKFTLKIECLLWNEQKYEGQFGVALYQNKYLENGIYSAIRIKTFSGGIETVFYMDRKTFKFKKEANNRELEIIKSNEMSIEHTVFEKSNDPRNEELPTLNEVKEKSPTSYLPFSYKLRKKYYDDDIKKLNFILLDQVDNFELFVNALFSFFNQFLQNKKEISIRGCFDSPDKKNSTKIGFYNLAKNKNIFEITKAEFDMYKKDKAKKSNE